uniref:DUF659 domain-containing protein n=2 Tax=Lactuca sativa TaxID=4236 RepID=A0A9R1X9J7_LACSA|nr:hypothetical protein LSAT_V11C600335280 [Lactuca sativa]KAJ0200507.1 hypothetical protein LSAT_V11C600335210 [Lactuca sativa]
MGVEEEKEKERDKKEEAKGVHVFLDSNKEKRKKKETRVKYGIKGRRTIASTISSLIPFFGSIEYTNKDRCSMGTCSGGIKRVKKHLAGIKGEDDDEEMEEAEMSNMKKGKRKSTSNLHPFFTKDKIKSIGYGYKAPNYHALRMQKKSVSLIIDSLRSQWVDTSCTIMSDGWRDISQRHLINFLVYCPKGISFLKSVDASDIEINATNFCNLFVEIVEMVGEKNVVQMVTDNVANYKLAGTKLCERYPSITWSPGASHCLNLVLKDLSELDNVKSLVNLASRVTIFVYNHKWPLNLLRKRPGWKEIICPGATQFSTVFIALQSLYDHKEDLQAMVISNEFKKILKVGNSVECKQIVLNKIFWKNCLIIVKVMNPLLNLLRMCDSDEKLAIGYVYEGMRQARRRIKELFKKKKELYRPYTKIIDSRWDRMLRKSIYCGAYWLNPVFQYDHANLCKKNEVFQGILEMVEKTFKGDYILNITLNLGRFRDAEDEWWKLFGGDILVLQKVVIRILSQTTSSSSCERNWSVFERIHMKQRNRLEHQRLNDLVFVHYKLRLQNRLKVDMRSYDPVDYENIDKIGFWGVEEDQEGELNYDDLENMLDEQEHEPASES